VVAAAVINLLVQVVLVVLAVAVLVEQMRLEQRGQQILAVEAVAVVLLIATKVLLVGQVALVLSFFPFQQQTTQAQPQAHQQSQQMVHIQF
jgi:hypothetical protein